MTEKLVIASNNKGKIAELAGWLAPLGITPIAQGELSEPGLIVSHSQECSTCPLSRA